MCVLNGYSEKISAARPPAGSASRSSVLSGRHVSGWAVPPARNLRLLQACRPGMLDTGATRNAVAALRHAAAGACFVFGGVLRCCCASC